MTNKVFLITGATSGIGEAVAQQAAQAGHSLILTGRNEQKLQQMVNDIGPDKAFAHAADVSDFKQLEQVFKAGGDHWGQIDVVFANAGVGIDQPGAEQGNPDEWDQVVDVNVKGLMWTVKLGLPYLKQHQGHLVITSSVAGKINLPGSVYGASKWFAYGFGHNVAKEMAEWNGRCTTICPGMVDTPFFDEPKPDKLQPEDVADAVMFAVNANKRCNISEITLMPTR